MRLRQSLSVILVSYRSRDDLQACLPTIFAQRHPAVEVIVVDNCPGDGTDAWLRDAYPDVTIVSDGTNGGYAGGNNLGLTHASNDDVLILNPDTRLEPGALDALQRALAVHPSALITAKLVTPQGVLNACGTHLHYTGISTCRGLGTDPASYAGVQRVPLLSGAAVIASRSTLEALGGFDADYFMYAEDTDLSLRAIIMGHPLLCSADAVITHDYALDMTAWKFHHLVRNRILTMLKVYERGTLLRIAPALLLTELAILGYGVLKGPAFVSAYLRAHAWLWRHRESTRAKRRVIQRVRRYGDERFLRDALVALPLGQLVQNASLARLLAALTQPIFRLLSPRMASHTP